MPTTCGASREAKKRIKHTLHRDVPMSKACFLFLNPQATRGRDSTHPRVAPPWMNPYVGEKKFGKFWKIANLSGFDAVGAVGGAFGDATNQDSPRRFRQTLVTRHRNSMDCK